MKNICSKNYMKSLVQITAGFCMLISGVFIYLFSRENPPEIISILKANNNIYLPDFIKYSSPTFFHCSGMILISIPFFGKRDRDIFTAAFLWLGIEIIFEVGQGFGHIFEKYLTHKLFLNFNNYFIKGIFDSNDIMAALAGALVAIAIYFATHKITENHYNPCISKSIER